MYLYGLWSNLCAPFPWTFFLGFQLMYVLWLLVQVVMTWKSFEVIHFELHQLICWCYEWKSRHFITLMVFSISLRFRLSFDETVETGVSPFMYSLVLSVHSHVFDWIDLSGPIDNQTVTAWVYWKEPQPAICIRTTPRINGGEWWTTWKNLENGVEIGWEVKTKWANKQRSQLVDFIIFSRMLLSF